MASTEHDRQVREAEELLFSGPERIGFSKALFFGRFVADWVIPYPELSAAERPAVTEAVAALRDYAEKYIDPAAIDRVGDIPQAVIEGLGRLGVLGMTAPSEFGGREFSQSAYCRVMEVLGGRCSATSIFVNAHHSIGLRALLLFGTEEQKRRWLPPLVRGERFAAFALTEPEAGSDAANVQTQAVPSPDGSHYILNGEKRYITNGAIAQVLTVMARTPVPGRPDTQVTAFLVTPDMPGFEVTEARMDKLGIRGTATARLAFHDMAVPKENILGPLGKGLRVALTVLDFGRTTFGACCTGAAKTCLRLAVEHARTRRQFGRPLAEFELVKKKIAQAAAWTYAIEACTTVTAHLIDRGSEDYMLETAMLKVFSTEALWTIINDIFQIHGGAAYFTDRPLERMLRDARINQIGEGANDVLLSFIALVGMRGPGLQLKEVWEALHQPWRGFDTLWQFGQERMTAALSTPQIPVRSESLQPQARQLARLIRRFGMAVQQVLRRHREAILDRQYVQARIAEAAMEIFASSCVLSRIDGTLANPAAVTAIELEREQTTARYFLMTSARRVQKALADLHNHDEEDKLTTAVADMALRDADKSR
jgi:alkylation response protein AidB-like acyl-CoA dehydrogenase